MLLMSPRADIPRRAILGKGGVGYWNKLRAYHAENCIFAHFEHSGLRRLAAEFKGSRPKATTEGFGPEKFGKAVMPRRWSQRNEYEA
jgi:hypothetical protein